MEIEHIVKSSETECNELYMMAVSVASVTYPTVEEHNAAILAAMPGFKEKLDSLVKLAFHLGKKMSKSDEGDEDMYKAEV
jgi:hypothetical protein